MQLTYRGIQYKVTAPALSTIPGKAIGKYRGAILMSTESCKATTRSHSLNLVYRGVHYRPIEAYSGLIGLLNAI